MSLFTTRVSLLALAATASSIAVLAVVLSRPDALIDRSFTLALSANGKSSPVGEPAPDQGTAESALLQLSSIAGPAESRFGPARSLAAGDRVTIVGRDGKSRTLEVSEVRALAAVTTRIVNPALPQLLLVTSTVVGEPGTVVRFVIEDAGPDAVPLASRTHRAL